LQDIYTSATLLQALFLKDIKGDASIMEKEITGKAIGGLARANKLTQEERSQIARQGALARWNPELRGSMAEELCGGNLPLGDIDLECYVLKDKRRVFSKRAMARAIGIKSQGGNVLMRTINRKGLGSVVPEKLTQVLDNPILFKPIVGNPAHGYEATVLIELCDAIWEARKQGKLTTTQFNMALRAEIILRSAAKVGIVALIDEATGYIKDKAKEEYRQLFQEFIRNECRAWEREFPDQLFDMIYAIHKLPRKHQNKHPQFFGHFFRKYIYKPLAHSNGVILEMIDEKNPVVYTSGGRRYKIHTFLTEQVGLPALRAHYWQLLGIWNSTKSKDAFERGFRKAFPQFGDQAEFEFEG
jgi:hypothetical protein